MKRNLWLRVVGWLTCKTPLRRETTGGLTSRNAYDKDIGKVVPVLNEVRRREDVSIA